MIIDSILDSIFSVPYGEYTIYDMIKMNDRLTTDIRGYLVSIII